MTSPRTLVVIGASLAGAKAAEAARDAGFDGRIVLIGEERQAPYERPPLSKDVLRGEKDVESARVHPDGFYAGHDIELIHDVAADLDTVGRSVTLAGGSTIAFDAAVLATGASPRPLDVDGAGRAGVHYLRTADDAIRLREAIGAAQRVAVIGAGWIGSEVAASVRQLGTDVVLIDPAPTPLHRVLGGEIGNAFAQLHRDNGVDLRLGASVASLRGSDHVDGVVLNDGTIEAADVVVAGVGVTPRVDLAESARGLRVDNGVVVDHYLETNIAGISAAGDVANAWHPHYHRFLRVEHWANAQHQGTTAGRNAIGDREPYKRLPYFYSDQYDIGMEYVGHAQPDDEIVVRGDLTERKFIAFWHRNGTVSAAMHVNVWDVVEDLKTVIAARIPVDPARLEDPDVQLGDLVSP